MPLLLALAACTETALSKVEEPVGDAAAELTVTPARIDYGVLAPGGHAVEPVTLTSTGTRPVTVTAMWSDGSPAFALTAPEGLLTLAPGESAQVLVAYDPVSVADRGALHVESDGLHPVADVALAGAGAWPAIEVDPRRLDLVSVDGEAASGEVTITSVGAVPLTVDATVLLGDPFTATDPAPVTLDPGASTSLTVTYTPRMFPEAVSGELWIANDAPTGDVVVPLTGTSPPDCVGMGEAWDAGGLRIYSDHSSAALVVDPGGEDTLCMDDWYIVTSEDTQDAALGDPARGSGTYPGTMIEVPAGGTETFLAAHTSGSTWYCVEHDHYTSPNASFTFLGAYVPPPLLDLLLVGDQEGSWAYQDDNPVIVVGRTTNYFDLAWSGGELAVGVLALNIGSVAGDAEVWETIPAGWTASDFSLEPVETTTTRDGSTRYAFEVALDGREVGSDGHASYDRVDITYRLAVGDCSGQRVLREAEAWWKAGDGALIASTANPMVIDCW